MGIMQTKQILIALALLVGGVAVFGFLSSRTAPLTQNTTPAVVAESTYTEEGPYMSIMVQYPEAPLGVRTQIERGMGEVVNTFKANASVDTLTPEDIELFGLGDTRKFALGAEYKRFDAPGYTSYAYLIYEDMLGAHPNVYFRTFVFDTEGNMVTLSQLLGSNPQWLEELSLEASTQVVAEVKTRFAESLPQGEEGPDATGAIFDEGLAPVEDNFKNFVIDGEELVILIPPYQVAAYAAGMFEIRVPLAGLQ